MSFWTRSEWQAGCSFYKTSLSYIKKNKNKENARHVARVCATRLQSSLPDVSPPSLYNAFNDRTKGDLSPACLPFSKSTFLLALSSNNKDTSPVNHLGLLNARRHHQHTSTPALGMSYRRASMTHISHSGAQGCIDTLSCSGGGGGLMDVMYRMARL